MNIVGQIEEDENYDTEQEERGTCMQRLIAESSDDLNIFREKKVLAIQIIQISKANYSFRPCMFLIKIKKSPEGER